MTDLNVYAKAYELFQVAGADLSRYLEVRGALRALSDIDVKAVADAQRDWDAANQPLTRKAAVEPLMIFDGPFGWS